MIEWTIDLGMKRRLEANARHRNKKQGLTKSGTFSQVNVDIIGAWGEYAAAEHCQAEYDWEIRPGGDNGIDFTAKGLTYGAKFNHRSRGYLIIEEREGDTPDELVELKTDMLVLGAGLCKVPNGCHCEELIKSDEPVTIILWGWISREEFMEIKRYEDWGIGGRYYVDVSQLRDIQRVPALL